MEVIKLNVGGTIFQSYRKTLLFYEGSFFQELLDVPARKDGPVGEIFIDRDPVLFGHVLNMLRNVNRDDQTLERLLLNMDDKTRVALNSELQYFKLDDLSTLVVEMVTRYIVWEVKEDDEGLYYSCNKEATLMAYPDNYAQDVKDVRAVSYTKSDDPKSLGDLELDFNREGFNVEKIIQGTKCVFIHCSFQPYFKSVV